MKDKIFPAPETLAAHEQAAAEITELRRRGIHCHIEDHASTGGTCDVVLDPEGPVEPEDPMRPKLRLIGRNS
ncbi:hypothetical protein OJ996_00430 [Luteolibacter sp. GHJ8]|jgi:hypothetical protein|uniref:PASTA domain-containing protein n=1 Tax=Luteolibacter rhizosphaerae TaxID=2989719 RepID=A0ABT3FWR2_9BACT|nr:hypothetical protein [Luteolibacter rhizosphaerae]MCW1912019.1 hypothetical protein [Luteolibacter rhizosphaerae]